MLRFSHVLVAKCYQIKAKDFLDKVAACAMQPRDFLSLQQVNQMKSLEDIYKVAMDENTHQPVQCCKALLKSDLAHRQLGVEAP